MRKGLLPVIVVCSTLLFSACLKEEETAESRHARVQITEVEQQSFEGCLEPGMLTQESALASLDILARGDHETIRYYGEFEQSEENVLRGSGEMWYENDICVTVRLLSKRNNPEAYDLILQVIEHKNKYPKAMVCAIRAIMIYGEFKDGIWHGDKRSIPVLNKTLSHKDPDIRLHTAGALLSLGEGDLALPVIDELAKAGTQRSVLAMYKLFPPEETEVGGARRIIRSRTRLFDERGKDLLVRALNYSSDEVKAFAASRLAYLGVEKKRARDTAIKILRQRSGTGRKDQKGAEERIGERNTMLYALEAIENISDTEGSDLIRALSESHTDSVVRKRAHIVMDTLNSKQFPP